MLIYFQSIFLKLSKCIALSVNSKNISEIYAFNFKFLRAGDDWDRDIHISWKG